MLTIINIFTLIYVEQVNVSKLNVCVYNVVRLRTHRGNVRKTKMIPLMRPSFNSKILNISIK